jgi:hypothetical protein
MDAWIEFICGAIWQDRLMLVPKLPNRLSRGGDAAALAHHHPALRPRPTGSLD